MKKLLLTITAIAALAACSKSHIEYDEPVEIAFNPIAGNVTKSMMTSQGFEGSESFNVWAWYKQVVPGTTVADWTNPSNDDLYIKEGTFKQKGTTWAGDPTAYYWPKVGSLLFAGYYPTSMANKVDYVLNANENQMVFTDIPQSKVESTGYSEDLMYFKMTEKSVASGPVHVVFKHALSWVTVNLVKGSVQTLPEQDNNTSTAAAAEDEEEEEENTKTTVEYPIIRVNKVSFTNIASVGTGYVDGSYGSDGIIECESGTRRETIVTPDGGLELTTTPATQVEPLFIPQLFSTANNKLPEMNIEINYTIFSSAEESFTETYTIALSSLTPEGATAKMTGWEPGKHYIYNISIGLTQITIDPKVDTWKEVNEVIINPTI